MTPLISIIVPVYKVEQFLPRCIDSILNQTFTDFELLLIDDGSPDNSGAICDEYALKDKRVRVFHKENGGVSSARNVGLDNAKGEWITFIDADDCISHDFLEIGKYNYTDVIQKSYCILDEINNVKEINKVLDYSLINSNDIHKFYVQKLNNALWNKIISKKIIKNKRFNENVSIGEDFLFSLSLLQDIKTYSFSSIGTYYYYIRENSAMQIIKNNTSARKNILIQNIYNINTILKDENMNLVRNGIIYSTYANLLFKFRKELDKNQILFLLDLFKKMNIKSLVYVSFPNTLKLLIKKTYLSILYRR